MKKALILASVASMIEQFNMPNIELLIQLGYQVDVPTNLIQCGNITTEKAKEMQERLMDMGVRVISLPIPRNIFSLKNIFQSYRQVKKLCDEEEYMLVHCHSPIGGVIARKAAKKIRQKVGTKVIYTAHGFHFYKGASIKNWCVFYPIEKICSKWTDVLITLNQEDYNLAKKKMSASEVRYLPGIGIDLKKFGISNQREEIRLQLGISPENKLLLSVGELNNNKNHRVVIQAIAKLNDPALHYCIIGKGELRTELETLAQKLGVNNRVHLLGYRTDVSDWYKAADVFVFPSYREGLSVSLMEAMASGLPCIVSKIRGNVDLIDESGGYLCNPSNIDDFCESIKKFLSDKSKIEKGIYNKEKIKTYSLENVMLMTEEIYRRV